MPKVSEKSVRMVYPAGCKEISDDLTKDELLKRLKLLSRAFQEMGQEEENSQYRQLAIYLASEFFVTHQNRDVRLLVACCIADIFRIFAPDAPYTDHDQLKEIFMFFTQQLQGLKDPDAPFFKRYFYLLENLAYVKSFSICIELQSHQEIFCDLFQFLFSVISEKHSSKVPSFMLDIMTPLLTEADSISQPLLDIILLNIVEPQKSQNKHAYKLAHDLIRRSANALEPYLQTFFNSALMLGKSNKTLVARRLYDFVFELNAIAPTILLSVLPQLEFKLKSSDKEERVAVTKLLARMFSAPDSDLATQNKPLWLCFLGRFNDIDDKVRRICAQTAQQFIVNHHELVDDIAEHLCQRQHDPDEDVRMDVVQTIVSAVRRQMSAVPDSLLQCVSERTLDKKFKIRKEALMGLGLIYRRGQQVDADTGRSEAGRVAWIRDKILHVYYQTLIDDKILVERILNASLVPYSLEPTERMRKLYILYANVDDNSVKALHEVFKTQLGTRGVVRSWLELLREKSDAPEQQQLLSSKLVQLARSLPDPAKAQDHMRKLNKLIRDDGRAEKLLTQLVSPDCTCRKAEECVKELLKKLGNPVPQNLLYATVKALLERIAPLMIDAAAMRALLPIVDDAVRGLNMISDDVPDAIGNGMRLLMMLSQFYPAAFQSEEVFAQLIAFVKHEEDVVSDTTLQIFTNIGKSLHQSFPNIYSSLLPVLQKMVKLGTPKQAKHAIRCIDSLVPNKSSIYQQIFEHLEKSLDLESPYFLTTLVALGHLAQLDPDEFGAPLKTLVSKFVVKEVLMQDRVISRQSNESWCADHLVSEETQAKLLSLKMMVRWLLGVRSNAANSASSTLRLLHTLVLHEGDLMENGAINKAEMARLRLQAGCCTLKLAQEACFNELIGLDEFQTLALLLNDPCFQVRVQFSAKLHRGLLSMRLPLQYLSMFCLAANDPVKERRAHAKYCLVSNIARRRDYLKQHSAASARMFSLLPDYVLPYVIHLLAHDPDFTSYTNVETLKNVKECLWFVLEPLITKNDNYSYSFYKKMIENIKQTKDAQAPTNEEANLKLYAVCDLALSLVLNKSTNLVLKDFPAEPLLPSKLFTKIDQSYSNTKCYLPSELISGKVGKSAHRLPAAAAAAAAGVTVPAGATAAAPAEKTSRRRAASTEPVSPASPRHGTKAVRPASPASPCASASSSTPPPSAPTPPPPAPGRRRAAGKGSPTASKGGGKGGGKRVGRPPTAGRPAAMTKLLKRGSPTKTKTAAAQSKMTDFVTRSTTSPRRRATPVKRTAAGRGARRGAPSPRKAPGAGTRGRPRKARGVAATADRSPNTSPSSGTHSETSGAHNTPPRGGGARTTTPPGAGAAAARSSPRKGGAGGSSQESTSSHRTRGRTAAEASPIKVAAKRNVRRALSNGATDGKKDRETSSSPAAKRKRGSGDDRVGSREEEKLNIRRRNTRKR